MRGTIIPLHRLHTALVTDNDTAGDIYERHTALTLVAFSKGMSDLSPNVASWRNQIERMSGHGSPYRYLLPTRWPPMRANALTVLDQFGAEEHRLGCTAKQLFGVHPQHAVLWG